MPLPPASPQRQLRHRRTVDVHVYARADGLWEVDAHLVDVKTRDVRMAEGMRPAGVPIHELTLRLVIDAQLNVVQAGSASPQVPYPGHCDDHDDAYAALAGLNLGRGFRRAVAERLGGVRGCTHLTELAHTLPTAVIQGFAGEVIDTRGEHPTAGQPFQIDRCHALRSDAEAVRLHYPRWYRQADAKNTAHNPPASVDSATGRTRAPPPLPSAP
jgi:Protein of unknown function (DUF2889)